jgi:argininosuccinate lyase
MSLSGGGRLPTGLDAAMTALNTSVHIDRELWREDIAGSIAHARGLARAGVISDEEARALVDGLVQVGHEVERGDFKWDPQKEDVHMNIEARLTELVGAVGGKLHTGRSRNDQIATDLRLWSRRKSSELSVALGELADIIMTRAEESIDLLMPAYTHLQRAQPSRVSHHLMAWQELLWRDLGRLSDATRRLNECPLGAGAAAGTGFPLDRAGVARELGFDHPMRNSLDATASRDFLMELGAALAILGVHLSRIGEELVIWSTVEFGFVTLSDAFSTSSSMMPQKKNPDVAELVRGRAARSIGDVTSLLVLEKSLSFGYGRDLQEDKLPIMSSFDSALICARALGGAIGTLRFNADRLRAALSGGHLCATDVADQLVKLGMPFRSAHHAVGQLVRRAEELGVQLDALPFDEVRAVHPGVTREQMAEVLSPEAGVERRQVLGGPARVRVVEAIADARVRWAGAVPPAARS